MLQIAIGGYKNVSSAQTVLDDSPIYYEPGFTILSPLELSLPESDQIYVLLRKRADSTGNNFEQTLTTDFNLTIKDATTGDNIPGFLDTNVVGQTIQNDNWDTDISQFQPLVLVINNSIDVFNPVERVRLIDVLITDKLDNDAFIFFRLNINDSTKLINYLNVNIDEIGNRFNFSTASSEIVINVSNPSDNYILFSPFSYFKEVNTLSESDFSYPLESVFYKRQDTFNNEGFELEISDFSHDFIEENVRVFNIPNFKKAGVLLLDKYLHTEMLSIQEKTYFYLKIEGLLSGVQQSFRVNLVR